MTGDGPRLGRLVLRPYRVPLARPWKSARGRTLERSGWLVGVEDAEGARGIGECAPLEGAGTESPAAALAALQAAVASIPGLLPSAAMVRLPPAACPAARCGVETALLDLAARRAGLPLYRWLARGGGGNSVAVNGFAGAVDEGLPARLARAVAAGFVVVKLKLAIAPPDEELPALAAAARSLPRGTALRLDVNRGWRLAQAEALLPRLASLPVEALEEPAGDADADGLARLQAAVPYPIALDESLGGWPADAPLPVRRQVLKPMVVGGPSALLRFARRPATQSVVTSSVDTATGLWLAAHLAAALDNGLAHGLDTGDWLSDLLGPPLPIAAGRLTLPDTPGLGVGPDEAFEK